MDDKVRENRLRRMADRQGLRLLKSRRRDELALDYGQYAIVSLQSGGTIHPHDSAGRTIYVLDLDDVAEYLENPAA